MATWVGPQRVERGPPRWLPRFQESATPIHHAIGERPKAMSLLTADSNLRRLVATLFAVVAVAHAQGCNDTSGLSPGCRGSPGANCSSYPEGTQCPGGSEVCVMCGNATYTLAPGDCICKSSVWSCGGASNVVCPSCAPGTYSDPTCTTPHQCTDGAPTDGATE
jgi:hypothetical protein